NFAFFIHTAMIHERLLSTCCSGTRLDRRSNLHYVEANTDREWLSVGEISSEARSMQIRPSGLQGYYSLTPTSNLICNAPVCRAPVCRTFIEKSEASTVKRSAGFEICFRQ